VLEALSISERTAVRVEQAMSEDRLARKIEPCPTFCSPTGPARVEAAFFDLDLTVIGLNSTVAFSVCLYRAGLLSWRELVRGTPDQLRHLYIRSSEASMGRLQISMGELAAGWDRRRVSAAVERSLPAIIESVVFPGALRLIREHRAWGREVLIVSASPEDLVAPVAHYLGASGLIASKPCSDRDNRYTGQLEFLAYGLNKAAAIRELAKEQRINLAHSYAYSDSYSDLPMLESVGHPVAVNPDRRLRRTARNRGWETREFRIAPRAVDIAHTKSVLVLRALALLSCAVRNGAGGAGGRTQAAIRGRWSPLITSTSRSSGGLDRSAGAGAIRRERGQAGGPRVGRSGDEP
jgi:HAD superfamily hydrolase (TIGR01490 family)